MTVDDAGLIWITNVWLALGFLLIALGLTMFSHGWIATGRAPRPRQMAVRMPRRRPRLLSAASYTAPAPRPTVISSWRAVRVPVARPTPPYRKLVA